MPKKKKEDSVEETSTEASEAVISPEDSVEAKGNEPTENSTETAHEVNEEKPATISGGEGEENAKTEEPSLISSVFDTVTSVVSSVADTVVGGATGLVNVVTGNDAAADSPAEIVKTSKRAEKIGTVQSDKMTNTVTVRVDRVVKHPMYRKYIKRRKKFMAHDVLGAKTGDKVRIVETRPLSAKKRWRVVEIIQKAER